MSVKESRNLTHYFEQEYSSTSSSELSELPDEVSSVVGIANSSLDAVESNPPAGMERNETETFLERELFGSETEDDIQEDMLLSAPAIEMRSFSSSTRIIPDKSNLFSVKLPHFISYDPVPFDSDAYVPRNSDGSDLLLKLQIENTIRSRFHNGRLQSNARIIKWKDGSMSLQLGNEIFSVQTQSTDNKAFLFRKDQDGLYCQSVIEGKMRFQPHSTNSLTHKRLTRTIAKKHVKGKRMKMVVTDKDPEMVKLEAERAEAERLRAQRRLTNRKNQMEARSFGLTEEGLEAEENSEDDTAGYVRNIYGRVVEKREESEYESEEMDLMIEEAKSGREIVTKIVSSDEEDNVEEVISKKRKVVLSDDDD